MKFQTILLTVFGILAVVGLVAFSKSDPKSSKDPKVAGAQGTVVIWGTFPENEGLGKMFQAFNEAYKDSFSVVYQYHDRANFDQDIVEALSKDAGPDILLLPEDLILRHGDKIEEIPYLSMPQATFSGFFIQAAEIYMRPTGLVALPFALDPMVMYWNRDLFNNASVTTPPTHWDEFLTLVPKLTKRDPKTTELTQSAVSFGEYANVNHAKDVVSMLFLQVGNPIVKMVEGRPAAALAVQGVAQEVVPDQDAVSALRFFMDFSNPVKPIYTWSRAKEMDVNEFSNGSLAMYFGLASEYDVLQKKNPHLNFSVTGVPQPRGERAETTFGKVHGLAVLKKSRNKGTAFIAVQRLLMDPEPAKKFAEAYNLPPVRRDMLGVKPTDLAYSVFYDAAIRAKTWLDPRPEVTEQSYKKAIESISSGRETVPSAMSTLNSELSTELLKY